MTPDEAKRLLSESAEDEEPICLPPAVLKHVAVADVPKDTSIQVGVLKDNVIHLEWEGYLRNDKGKLVGEAEYVWTRKYWYSPIGLEQYLDLVRRAVEVRVRTHGDVTRPEYDDDGAFVQLRYGQTGCDEPLTLYHQVKAVCEQLEVTAEQASADFGNSISEVAARVSGWGSETLDALVDAVDNAKSTDDKGRSLEELFSRLLETVPGFSITGRIKTATEEIDISVLNDGQGHVQTRNRHSF